MALLYNQHSSFLTDLKLQAYAMSQKHEKA